MICNSAIKGIFIKELKNRFLCEVNIDGEVKECYVPSSCHLSNFLNLKNKNVILVKTQTKNSRTEYSLFAVPFKRNFLVLNTSLANKAVENSIASRKFAYMGSRKEYFTEHKIEDYKADIYIPRNKTIIEVKSVLASNKKAVFPTVYSERTQHQLVRIQELLRNGYKVCFLIVSLNPYLESVELDKNTVFYSEIIKCIDSGLNVKAYTSFLDCEKIKIKKEIPVIL